MAFKALILRPRLRTAPCMLENAAEVSGGRVNALKMNGIFPSTSTHCTIWSERWQIETAPYYDHPYRDRGFQEDQLMHEKRVLVYAKRPIF
jgi:hypothetical protein